MAKQGRPTDFTPELGDLICDRISEGTSLRKICLDDDMPNRRTVFRWLRTHADFCHQYDQAVEERAEHLVEEMLEIADSGEPEMAQVNRLRVDTRKWAASKFKPKKYGDRQVIAGDEDAPLAITEVKRVIINN